MDDHGQDFPAAVRAVLAEAGFGESALGAEGVHVVEHARGVMVGWMPRELRELPSRRRGPRRTRSGGRRDLPGLRHAFGLALAAAFRAAGFSVETRGDEWLLVVRPGSVSSPARPTA
ncbi:hypothetical protein [Streptomyces sp. NPDC060031]|uniref:hypothetical protein n=1 Tax=Streptomyces sp. NPDC060031 TaxID=3347043 RepID=UPI0036C7FC35